MRFFPTRYPRSRFSELRRGLLAASLLAASGVAAASGYPDRPITIVLPYTAGGSSDWIARAVSNHLNKVWKQPVIVESRSSAGGMVGMEAVARAKPDGYTLVIMASGTMAINPHVNANVRYDPFKDFAPIATLVEFPLLLVSSPRLPAKTFQEFVAYAKANPGKVTMGNIGTGTQQHLSQVQLAQMAGIDMALVPYKGSAELVKDFLGGHIDVIFDNVANQRQYITSGRSLPLAVTSKSRLPQLADVPTVSESGLPGYEAVPWFGLAAPAGTPGDIVQRLNKEVANALADPEVRKYVEGIGMVVVFESPEKTAERIRHDHATFGKVARTIKLKPE